MLSVIEYRRALHRIPELDDRLPETCAYVHSALASFELEAFSPIPSSVCAYLDAGKAETVAFRADMDALPIEEAPGLAYAQHPVGPPEAAGLLQSGGAAGKAGGHLRLDQLRLPQAVRQTAHRLPGRIDPLPAEGGKAGCQKLHSGHLPADCRAVLGIV